MKNPAYFWQENMGKRFKLFRQLVEKSCREMASELKKPLSHILRIEKGKVMPTLDDILELYKRYGLNNGWLMCGNENIFLKKKPKTPDHAYIIGMLAQYEGMEIYVPCKKKQLPVELQEIIRKIEHFLKRATMINIDNTELKEIVLEDENRKLAGNA